MAQLNSYQQASASLTVASGVVTGPGADIQLTAVVTGALTAGQLWEYTRRQARDVVDSTRANLVIKEIVDDALMMVATIQQWPWLQDLGTVNTRAAFREGTVNITQDSPIVTLIGAVWPAWVADGEIYIDGVFRRILSRDSDTQITLDAAYPEETRTDVAHLTYQDTYDLPDNLLRMGDVLNHYWLHQAMPTTYLELQRQKAEYVSAQQPADAWAIHDNKVAVWPPPSDNRILTFVYWTRPAPLVSSGDSVDWNPTRLTLLHRAIDYQICLKWGSTSAGINAEAAKRAFDQEAAREESADMRYAGTRRPMARQGARSYNNKLGII